ncbi:putative ribonuclease H-like domain-containing protein [Tanacetum coccineum]
MTTTTTPVTNAQLKALIDQGIVDALVAGDADRSMNGDDSYNSRTSVRRTERVARECTYLYFMKCQPLNFKGTEGVVELTQCALTWWNSHVRTVGHDVAYAMTWTDLKKKMTDKYFLRSEIKKLEVEMWNLKVKELDKIERYVSGLPDMIHGSMVASKPKTMQEAIEMATELMDKKICTFAERQTENKRKQDDNNNQAQQKPPKKQVVAIAYTAGSGERKEYAGTLPLCNKCKFHHNGQCTVNDDEASNHEDASDTSAAPKQQQQQVIPQTTAISNIKLPILKKEEYDIWAMEMEHYLEYIDNAVWKARNANMFADGPCPRNNLRRFIGMDDAKEIWEAIKTSTITLGFLSKGNQVPIKKHLQVLKNVAFVSQSKSSTNMVKSGFTSTYSTCSPSTSSTNTLEKEALVGFADEISRVPQEVYVSKPITTNEEGVSALKSKEVEPSCVTHIKNPRQLIKDQETPKVNRKNWNAMMERELGEGYSFTKKKCFVCGSLSHLIKDRDYYEKKMAREAAPKKQRVFNTGNRVTKPVWNNADRINHANHFVPRSAILNFGKTNVNSVRPNVNTIRTHINSVRPRVSTVSSNVNTVRSRQPDHPLKNMVDRDIFDSGCSGHMTGNKDQLEDFKEFNEGFVTFGGSKGYITGKGRIRVGNLDFDSVSFVKELGHFNLFSISQICDKQYKVLFTETECLVVSSDFKMPDENQILLKHRRLGHINFKNLNKLVKGNLIRGLPSKVFRNDHTCVACHKGKQHRASCKAKLERLITEPLHNLHMDLFGPTSIKIINYASYCLVITDDCTRFSWVFFLASKDETSGILQNFIRQIENQLNHRVKIIRSDNGTEFKNRDMLEFCGDKGIKQEYSNARTPQQNGVAERMNRTLIEAARTMLADSLLPTTFWAEAVSTACYIFNRVRVTKPQNKTPYELLFGHKPIISYIRPFGCHVTILDTLSVLGKFDGKSDEGFLVGYSLNSKAYRVYNLVTKRVEVNLHVNFLEDKPNVKGVGYRWMFDIDYLTDSMNYIPVSLENQANPHNIHPKSQILGDPTLRIHNIYPKSQILGDPKSAVQTRSKEEPKKISEALQDDSWVQAMQD